MSGQLSSGSVALLDLSDLCFEHRGERVSQRPVDLVFGPAFVSHLGRGDDVGGLGVSIARRDCDLATDRELLASRTVKDLAAGSGTEFIARGTHELKGVPDDWQLFAVTD